MSEEPLVVYTAKICPFSQRVRIALEEAGAKYTNYEIDLNHKPEWYVTKVNPASKVPAIAYGGPASPPDAPSDQSIKLAESAVLVELVADLYPEAKLMPSSPIERAQVRFFVEFVGCKLLPAFFAFVFKGAVGDPLKNALDTIQQRLPRNSVFFGGDKPNIADISIVPFLARIRLQLKHDLGTFPEGEGLKLYEEVFEGEQFRVLREYTNALFARESFKKTFDEAHLLAKYKERLGHIRRAKSTSPPPSQAGSTPPAIKAAS
ncbi:glutathione transferase, putative [Rhizoctonia solani AG-3 Rhs1AP]|uniref:Glutathione S-transferase, carboxy-terminal domain protein n=2 Tax=Rhizoctonia solani AG-3 TaxID=1086053 RepID=A0A074RW67_9AGAM|nr:glutathione transferase, putative [Rhizoctonia solani AG-3 Rhs1AP]KEP51331.1 glutathione S-transferase, carboxy-terminal domain protein [Rhizoctonia solani 123E]